MEIQFSKKFFRFLLFFYVFQSFYYKDLLNICQRRFLHVLLSILLLSSKKYLIILLKGYHVLIILLKPYVLMFS